MNNNKLIAEFMGGVMHEGLMSLPDDNNLYNVECQLHYHTSWDWLMPVANEIIKSRDEQNADWDLTDLKYALCTTNIEYVYNAVVEFIKNQ